MQLDAVIGGAQCIARRDGLFADELRQMFVERARHVVFLASHEVGQEVNFRGIDEQAAHLLIVIEQELAREHERALAQALGKRVATLAVRLGQT